MEVSFKIYTAEDLLLLNAYFSSISKPKAPKFGYIKAYYIKMSTLLIEKWERYKYLNDNRPSASYSVLGIPEM